MTFGWLIRITVLMHIRKYTWKMGNDPVLPNGEVLHFFFNQEPNVLSTFLSAANKEASGINVRLGNGTSMFGHLKTDSE